MKKKIYSVTVPLRSQTMYDDLECNPIKNEEMKFPSLSYDFSHMSIEQVALQAKTDKECFFELFNRMIPDMYRQCQCIVHIKKNIIEFSDAFAMLVKVLKKGVMSYDESRGKFKHFYYFLSAFALKRTESNSKRDYARQSKYLGKRVTIQDFDTPYISDIKPIDEEYQKKATKIDLDEFLNKLTGRKKEILTLYFFGYTYRQISDMLIIPYTTIVSIVKKLIEEFELEGALKRIYHKR